MKKYHEKSCVQFIYSELHLIRNTHEATTTTNNSNIEYRKRETTRSVRIAAAPNLFFSYSLSNDVNVNWISTATNEKRHT